MTFIPSTGANFGNQQFINVNYSTKLVTKFYAESVCGSIFNTHWQQTLVEKGQSVVIRERPTVTVTPTGRNFKTNWTPINDTSQTLTIDYAFEGAVTIDSIDMHQFDINVQPEIFDEISNQLRMNLEVVTLGSIYSQAGTQIAYSKFTTWNTSGSPQKYVTEAHALLDMASAPQENRWLLLHPRMLPALKLEQFAFALNAGTAQGALQRGFVFELDGFKIYVSKFVPGTGLAAAPYQALAGHFEAVTLATQFTDFQILPFLESQRGIGIRCTNGFGFKALKPDCLISLPSVLS